MIKRPGNEFVIVDQSGQYTTTETPEMAPLILAASSFDKGPEGLMEVSGDDFFRYYGENISFERHGQPAIQAANVIRNGGRLLIKRIVADDATLANAIITATVSKVQVPKVDPTTGKNIYIDRDTGMETTDPVSSSGQNNERAIINTANIKYGVVSVEGAKNMKEIQLAAAGLLVERDPIIPPESGDNTGSGEEGTGSDNGGTDTATTSSSKSKKNTKSNNTVGTNGKEPVPSALPGKLPLPIGLYGPQGEESEYTYPLFIVADNGRGVSAKRFNIVPDYAVSKNVKFVLYRLTNIGSLNLDSEYIRFATHPDTIYNNENMSLSESGKEMDQLKPASYIDGILKFMDKVSEFSGIDVETLKQIDVLFGHNNKGEAIENITVDPEGYDLTSDFGINLTAGTNGAFGDKPFGTEAYTQKLVDFFEGTTDAAIFDVDQYFIEACVDANYPLEVKKAITELVNFRKDFVFFRDLGIGLESEDAIKLAASALTDTMYAANYCQSYDIIDPFTRRQITVTIGYDIARLLIEHLNFHRNAPFCGELYSINMPGVIEGTVSYIPRIMPKVDQKQNLYDIHMNYASMVNGVFTIETQVNSQTDVTQCSWINNILTIQDIIRDIRELCPRVRYSFIDQASGLERYAQDVNQVLKLHTEEVNTLEFEWSSDELELANHIFNATINVAFKEYVDFEKFTIFVID